MQTIEEFIKESQDFIIEKEVNDNYCIILYITSNYGPNNTFKREIKYIYKNFDEFQEKIEADILLIDSKYCINFQLWIFD